MRKLTPASGGSTPSRRPLYSATMPDKKTPKNAILKILAAQIGGTIKADELRRAASILPDVTLATYQPGIAITKA